MIQTHYLRCPLCGATNSQHIGLVRHVDGVYEQRSCATCGQVFLADDDGHEPPRPAPNVSGRNGSTTP